MYFRGDSGRVCRRFAGSGAIAGCVFEAIRGVVFDVLRVLDAIVGCIFGAIRAVVFNVLRVLGVILGCIFGAIRAVVFEVLRVLSAIMGCILGAIWAVVFDVSLVLGAILACIFAPSSSHFRPTSLCASAFRNPAYMLAGVHRGAALDHAAT